MSATGSQTWKVSEEESLFSVLPYAIYIALHWAPDHIDMDPYITLMSSTPLVMQLKVNLTLTVFVALDRALVSDQVGCASSSTCHLSNCQPCRRYISPFDTERFPSPTSPMLAFCLGSSLVRATCWWNSWSPHSGEFPTVEPWAVSSAYDSASTGGPATW